MTPRLSPLFLALAVAGCASAPRDHALVSATAAPAPSAEMVSPSADASMGARAPSEQPPQAPESRSTTVSKRSSGTQLYPGTDQMVKADLAPRTDAVLARGDRVSLNFEGAPIGQLAQALLGDLLQLNYTVDAGADIPISLRTHQPIPRPQVLDVLDAALLPHDLAIVRDPAGVYHVTKRSTTPGARPVVGAARVRELPGAGIVIAPLNHIGAAEMAKILAPVAPREALVHVDTLRNVLVLQGSKAQLTGWLDLVDAFDVDFLAGMSVGVFVLEYANVNDVRDAMQMLLGTDRAGEIVGQAASTASSIPAQATGGPQGAATATVGAASASVNPLAGLLRVLPIERLNALVVVTPRQHILTQVETWIRRLDRPTDAHESALFVYPVQHGSAVDLAEMLNGLFGADGARTTGVAAGNAPTQLTRASGPSAANPASATAANARTAGATTTPALAPIAPMGAAGAGNGQAALTSATRLEGNIRVVADEKRNALLIRAPRPEYRRIEQALRELDKAPAQVLIEASIVEVTLTGSLQYGVEWFLQNSLSGGREGQALLNLRQSGAIGPRQPGFSYTILNRAGVIRAALNALADNSLLRVLSNPSVLVQDNHNATIQIGRQQPIKTATTVATSNLVTESISYKDTGVMLSVTPSVNAGGTVTMDIVQQVTDVGEIDAATGQRNFLTRQIQSRVAVRSGETVVLGGLIRDNETNGSSGLPGLSQIPVLGALFGTQTKQRDRTELLVLLTPRALEDDDALRAASTELRERMRTLSLQAPVGSPAALPAQRD
ncbi:Type II secretion system protein D [Tepidimonas thermarum]|uniref:Type IV pilus biogenesis and competence protein PilQ n=1 Tax=Tepidimonas thermarum TaxID=335431 RepID=A0A554WYV8_9BURK|nr:Type II secretion system protein D [Tepidimonas thermarum]